MHLKFYTEFFQDVVESFLLNFTSNNFQVTLSWLDFVSTKLYTVNHLFRWHLFMFMVLVIEILQIIQNTVIVLSLD